MYNDSFKRIITVLLTLSILSILWGCSKKIDKDTVPVQTSSPASEVQVPKTVEPPPSSAPANTQTPAGKSNTDILKPESLKLPAGDYESIKKILESSKNIYGIKWSYNKYMTTFFLFKEENESQQMYIWKIGMTEPIIINEAIVYNLGEVYWSPNDEYIIIDSGTDVKRNADIISSKVFKKIDSICYYGNPIWAPDSKFIAMAKPRTIKTIVDTGLEGTTDIILYNHQTKETKTIASGGAEYFFDVKAWDKNGILTYTKNYFIDENKTETLTYK